MYVYVMDLSDSRDAALGMVSDNLQWWHVLGSIGCWVTGNVNPTPVSGHRRLDNGHCPPLNCLTCCSIHVVRRLLHRITAGSITAAIPTTPHLVVRPKLALWPAVNFFFWLQQKHLSLYQPHFLALGGKKPKGSMQAWSTATPTASRQPRTVLRNVGRVQVLPPGPRPITGFTAQDSVCSPSGQAKRQNGYCPEAGWDGWLGRSRS